MFFTRRWQDKIDGLERGLAATTARVRSAENLVSVTLKAHTELIQSFQKLQDQYTDGLSRARQLVDEVVEAAPTFSPTPLYATEEEEDLEVQLASGLLEDEDYKQALAAAGAVPNISIDR